MLFLLPLTSYTLITYTFKISTRTNKRRLSSRDSGGGSGSNNTIRKGSINGDDSVSQVSSTTATSINSSGKRVVSSSPPTKRRKQSNSYNGFDRQEVTKLITQACYDLGYKDVANELEDQSGYKLETDEIKKLRQMVISAEWDQVEVLMNDLIEDDSKLNKVLFVIRKQEYLELVENDEKMVALKLLRSKIGNLKGCELEIKNLARALVCCSKQLHSVMNWNGVGSRFDVFEEMIEFINPSLVLPSKRLANLFQQVKITQSLNNDLIQFDKNESEFTLYENTNNKKKLNNRKLDTLQVLKGHGNEVWAIEFSYDGKFLASGDKDGNVNIWQRNFDTKDRICYKILKTFKEHKHGVCSLSWCGESRLASCGYDKKTLIWNVESGELEYVVGGNKEVVSCCGFLSDGRLITSSPDTLTTIWSKNCKPLYKWEGLRILQFSIAPNEKFIVAMTHEGSFYVYSLENYQTMAEVYVGKRLSSVQVSKDSKFLLVSTEPDEIFIYSLEDYQIVKKYTGYQQSEYYIRSSFGGLNEQYILSGSEDKLVYIWNRYTQNIIERLGGHEECVNQIRWVPRETCQFASASDDKSIRIWGVLDGDDFNDYDTE